MKTVSVIASCALLTAAVSASPFPNNRRVAVGRRHARPLSTRLSSLGPDFHHLPQPAADGSHYTSPSKVKTADVSSTGPGGWAGLIAWNENAVTQVEATVSVPTPAIPPNGANSGVSYGGAAWVGIGAQSGTNLWQTGITWTIEGSSPSFTSWYEWYPAGSNSFSTDLEYNPGDQIYMSITATSGTSGTAYLENLSTGQSVTQTVSGQPSLGSTQGAEVLIEDFGVSSGSIPFAAFSPAVQFTDCAFTDAAGSNQGFSGASVLNVGSSSAPFTSTNVISSSSFSVSYTGNAANS